LNTNPQQFSRKELADFYEKLILLWENGDLLNQNFNIRSNKSYRRLKEKYDVEITAFTTLDETKSAYKQHLVAVNAEKNYINFHNAKSNIVKSYFYHIRNVAGHADIQKVKKKNVFWYIFNHEFKGQMKLFGQFKASDFWKVHDELVKLREKK
jgi:hypothetical protein